MRRIRVILATVLAAAIFGGCALAQESAEPAAGKSRYWVFLVTGKSAAGVAKEEIQSKQIAHIENFKRLAAKKELFAAGPMADPAKAKRGIVFVEAESLVKLPALFEPDPYVTEGFMKLDANKIVKIDGATKINLVEQGMDELRLAVWDRTAKKATSAAESAVVMAEHEAYWAKQRAAKVVGLRARFADDAPHFGIAIFPKSDDAEIKKLLDGDPLVKQGAINYVLMPQYLMKGAVSVE